MISIRNISKSFGNQIALNDLSLDILQGERFGLIGPDGAGKTTLFRILTTLLLPDSGSATVAGFDILKDYSSIRSRVGYMPGTFSLYSDLSVRENLEFFATVFGVKIEDHYELIRGIYKQLEPFKDRKAGALSGGMKQKLALSCALIHKPEVMFLDEPTTGVDPVSRKDFWDMLQSLKKYGITILVSTPYMEEAALCERIALMQDGELLSVDSPENTKKAFSATLFRIKSDRDMYVLLKALNDYPGTNSVYAFGDAVHYTDRRDRNIEASLRQYLSGHRLEIERIEAGVEDRYMELTEKDSSHA